MVDEANWKVKLWWNDGFAETTSSSVLARLSWRWWSFIQQEMSARHAEIPGRSRDFVGLQQKVSIPSIRELELPYVTNMFSFTGINYSFTFLMSEQMPCWPIYTRISGAWPGVQILLANIIGLFSMMSEVSGLRSLTPNVRLWHNVEVTN